MMDDDWSIFWGFGAAHELRGPPDAPEPRLWGMRSVGAAAARALAKKPQEPKSRPIGFRHVRR